jgi:hypothetical protein
MGRRWGKTFMAGLVAAEAARLGAHVAWVAPTYGNSRPLWRFLELIANQNSRVKMQKAEREMVIPGRGRVGVYTADNSVGMRGENFDIVICDEAAQYAPEVWTDVIMPTLADRDGMAYLISTPKGKNWFYHEYLRADGKQQARFHAPSADNPNPKIQRAAMLARDRVSERTYRQEWLAEFVTDGALFVNVEQCATASPAPRHPNHAYIIGVDWARSSSGDYTVFSVMDATDKTQAHVSRLSGQPFDYQLAKLKSLWQSYGECEIIAEYNSLGGPLVERLQSDGLPVTPFTTTAGSKHQIISGLELAFDKREITILADQVQTGELLSYERKDRAGLPSYSAPPGLHDDTVIALALAWHWCATGSISWQTDPAGRVDEYHSRWE